MSGFIPPDNSGHNQRLISKAEAKKLLKKLEMKYGVELSEITEKMKQEKQTLGYVTPETEARNELLIEKIKLEEKRYR